jgi:photosystem II stability/assembly factor-like uncharacterized protein
MLMRDKPLVLGLIMVCALISVGTHGRAALLRDSSGDPFTGQARFKAVILANEEVLWSNDGTSLTGEEPRGALTLDVKGGSYSLRLGEPPMPPLYPQLLELHPQAQLRTWIDLGGGFTLRPDSPLTAELVTPLSGELTADLRRETTEIATPGLTRNSAVTDYKIARKQGLVPRKQPRNPQGRANQRFHQRAGADGQIPHGALLRAKMELDDLRSAQPRDGGLWSWGWLGPGNIGGRIRALLIDPDAPDTMFVGSVSGGLWKTTNGGDSWSPVNDFLPSLSISSLIFDPDDHDVMYAGTGESFTTSGQRGAGIFKSTDRGDTWEQLPSTDSSDWRFVNDLVHHKFDTEILWACVKTYNRVKISTNGGSTWSNKLTPASAPTDIKIGGVYSHHLLVGCENDVYYSENNGGDWDRLTTGATDKLPSDPGRCEVSMSSFAYYVLMERNGGEVWRSTDSGETWTLQNTGNDFFITDSGGNQGGYDNVLWVNPHDSDFLVVGGIDLWRSTDGGVTFDKISDWITYHLGTSAHADHHVIMHHPDFDDSDNRRVFVCNDGGIQVANNIRLVSQHLGWENLANNLGITQFYSGSAATDGSVIIGGTQDNAVLRYRPEDGAQGWLQTTTGDGGFCAVDHTWPSTQIAELQFLQVMKSITNGLIWLPAIDGLTDADNSATSLFIAPLVMDPSDPTRLVAGGARIWETTNAADDWSSIRNPVGSALSSAIDIAVTDSDVIWVGYDDGQVGYTPDGGSNWYRVDENGVGLPDRWITDIAINPYNASEVFVTFSEYQNDNVWFTDDGGDTWQPRSGDGDYGLPALPVNTIRFHRRSDHWVYIGTDLGVFASEDLGQSWSVTPNYASQGHEGPINVEVDELFWMGGDYLVAATHGRGMYIARPMIIIYVDHLAAPGGDGSAETPFQTISEAVSAAGHGTTIHVNGGPYHESTLIIDKRGVLEVGNNGPVIID